MIEALGAKQQEASALRAVAPQGVVQPGDPADLPGPATGAAVAGAGAGPYYSPVVRLDAETQRTVITFRDVATGKVQTQYPSERQLEAYRSSLRQQKVREAEAAQRDSGGEPKGPAAAVPRTGDDRRDAATVVAFGMPSADGPVGGVDPAAGPDKPRGDQARLAAVTA
ncbi:hypothetical protein [Arenibaculum sp.]|jgi:hypothetical protein|uniref:hypothetical protein n=1 Tax=Arenibaculum sp. TaxID=2865862 RepID=UPI002E1647C6|nr:hypothetical protein [Arenibaculum sp.]